VSILTRVLAGELPQGAELVSERLIRRVFRFEDPGEGRLFAKQHLFPVLRVRLRYLLRSSPTAREAAGLEKAAERGLRVPRVVAQRSERGLLGPRLAVLVTEALPFERIATHAERFALARQLAELGVLHPDLHGDNVLRLADGELGLLDFQSVRFRRGPLRAGARRRMLAKCAHAALPELGVLGLRELLGADWEEIEPELERLDRKERSSRRRHALRSSTRFRRTRRGLFGFRVERRGTPLPAQDSAMGPAPAGDQHVEPGASVARWSPGVFRLSARGRRLRELWLGAVQQRDGEEVAFLAYQRDAPWPWSMEHLYIAAPASQGGGVEFTVLQQCLARARSALSRLDPWKC
jgi:hypothetical protein